MKIQAEKSPKQMTVTTPKRFLWCYYWQRTLKNQHFTRLAKYPPLNDAKIYISPGTEIVGFAGFRPYLPLNLHQIEVSMKYRYFTILILLSGFASNVSGDTSLQLLKEKCESARESKLAPEREALIQACMAEKEKTVEQCRRYYADYGAAGRTAAGAVRVRKYNDLPECTALYEAEK